MNMSLSPVFPNHFFCSEHFQKMVLYFAAFGSFNVKLQTELICILHWKWFLEKANVIYHQQQWCDAMRRKMVNSVWVWTESSVRSWYDLIIIWDYDADDDNDNDINDDNQRRKKCTFPIVRQFGRRCPFFSVSRAFYLVSCRWLYIGIQIVNNGITNDWGHSVSHASHKKIWQMGSNFCASTILDFSTLSHTHKNWSLAKTSQRNGRFYQSQTCIHTHTRSTHTTRKQLDRNQLVTLAKQTSITFGRASSPKLTTKFWFYHQRLHTFLLHEFPCFWDWISFQFFSLCVSACLFYVKPSKRIEISIFLFKWFITRNSDA